MNCDRVETMLADYLGDELGTGDREAFNAHLAACTACRGRVSGLTHAAALLSRMVPSTLLAEQAVLAATPPQMEVSPRATIQRSFFWPIARIAATLLVGFVIGHLARSSPQPPATSGQLVLSGDFSRATVQQVYADTAQRFPGKSGLAWGLLCVAKR